MQDLQRLKNWSDDLLITEKMPVLFMGHGSPMNAIEENEFVTGFRNVSKTLPNPTAILCVSAHWYTPGTKISSVEKPPTIHDFGGFPQELFEVQYPAPGEPALAQYTQELVGKEHAELDDKWGLDHGAWSVIKHLYPAANIPIIQMSIDYTKPPAYHFELAKQLSKLREKGVLIIGSGNIVHNLRMVDWPNFEKDNHGYDWAIEARATVNQLLLDRNFQPLLDYEKLGSALKLAIPTPDHYLPLIYTAGLYQKNEDIQLFNDKLMAGSLSMTSLKIA
jgi:4,5-DOPA dioxygenase extradiol